MIENEAHDDDWGDDGWDAIDEENKRQSAPRAPRRWYLPAETTDHLTFVSDLPFTFKEHNLKLDGHWRNWFTCLGPGCPLCKSGNDAYLAAAWLAVDHGSWTDNDGNEHKDEPRLFVAKARVAARLKKKRERTGTLSGTRWEVYRSGKMAPNTGDQFDHEKTMSASERKRAKWWPSELEANLVLSAEDGEARRANKAGWRDIFPKKDPDELRNIVSSVSEEIDDDDAPVRF